MILDWLRLWPEFIRLNVEKTRHAKRLLSRGRAGPDRAPPPAPCQSGSDSGRAHVTRCEACLRVDHARRYRHVCPALRVTPEGAFCSVDSAQVRPDWPRALVGLSLPPLALLALGVLLAWATLRFGVGLQKLAFIDVAWPPRWHQIERHRHAHFSELALQAVQREDFAAATVAIFSAVQSGSGGPGEDIALARLATLGRFHSLVDRIYATSLAAHPDRALELTIAWHDDLLIADRPLQLAHLSLDQLARPGAPREPWLRAFLEAIRHRGVAASLLASASSLRLPHPGLRHALAAREALDRQDKPAAADQLLALEGLMPGQAARRFVAFSWIEAGSPTRARAAALSREHPAPPGEVAVLHYTILRSEGRETEARAALRPLFRTPSLLPLALAALVRDPDPVLLSDLVASLPAEARSDPEILGGLWLAATRAAENEIASATERELEKLGREVPAQWPGRGVSDLSTLGRAAGLVPMPREVLYALRESR